MRERGVPIRRTDVGSDPLASISDNDDDFLGSRVDRLTEDVFRNRFSRRDRIGSGRCFVSGRSRVPLWLRVRLRYAYPCERPPLKFDLRSSIISDIEHYIVRYIYYYL